VIIAEKLPPSLFACLAAFSLVTPVHAVTLISDNTFNTTDWNASKVDDTTLSGDAIVVANQSATGGNPGAYWDITHEWDVNPSGVTVTFAHMFTPSSYDPSTGAIDSLTVSFDAFCDFAPIVAAIGFGPMLKQDGIYYAHSGGAAALVGFGWSSFNFPNLTELSFIDYYDTGLAHPDFSATGSPIELGFWSGNGGSGFTSANHTAGGRVDNFEINAVITPIPEPSQFALAAASGIFSAFRRRNRPARRN
jgi:hypothetical protein